MGLKGFHQRGVEDDFAALGEVGDHAVGQHLYGNVTQSSGFHWAGRNRDPDSVGGKLVEQAVLAATAYNVEGAGLLAHVFGEMLPDLIVA